MSAAPARPGPIRWISIGAFGAWGLLFAATYGYVPGLKHAWGFGLLRYLEDWVAWLLTGVALLVTTDEARRGVLRAAALVRARTQNLSPRSRGALLFLVAAVTLWLVRERVLLGDSILLHSLLTHEGRVTYPEPGGLALLLAIYRLAGFLALPPLLIARLLACLAGAATIVFVVRASRLTGATGGGAHAIAPLAFSGGMLAALAGRLEIQPFALAASAAYLWLALRFLHGGLGFAAAALALGVASWLQPWCLLLFPGLVLLRRLRGERVLTPALGLVALPLLLHVTFLLAWNPDGLPATIVLARALGSARTWVRLPGGAPSIGTDYVLFSRAHLKYLGNAAFVLAPASLPLALGLLAAPCRAFATAPARFLGISAAGLLVAACGIRPVWGPFDWDLFCVTALCLVFLAGVALDLVPGRQRRAHLAVVVVGLQLCFVGIPMLSIGQGAQRAPGPFVAKRFDPRLFEVGRKPPRRIAPWL